MAATNTLSGMCLGIALAALALAGVIGGCHGKGKELFALVAIFLAIVAVAILVGCNG